MSDRQGIRATWHKYDAGVYFVTICTDKREHLFGSISQSRFYPSELGKIVSEKLIEIPKYYPDAEIWNYVVMPNHVHFILAVGARLIAPAHETISDATETPLDKLGCLKPPRHGESVCYFHHSSRLSGIVGSFKAGVTRMARARLIAPLHDQSVRIWQRNYHEHIIRNQHAYDNISDYIRTNVENWHRDCFNISM